MAPNAVGITENKMRFAIPFVFLSTFCLAVAPDKPPPDKATTGWTTYRGNPARTGNSDGKAGPAAPKVLWVFRSNENFIASPVPAGDRLYLSGLGAFNVPTFYALHLDAKGDKQVAWSKTQPLLKQPTVSSPAIADGKIVFGDGMHQNDGAYLHVWGIDGESPLWQLPVPGKLVHLEGSPTIVGKKAYLGGGNAGVLCVDLDRATLDGKEMPVAKIAQEIESQWKVLLKKYEVDRKKDPDFAVKPTRDKLPKPAPVKLWQQGVGQVACGCPGGGGRRSGIWPVPPSWTAKKSATGPCTRSMPKPANRTGGRL